MSTKGDKQTVYCDGPRCGNTHKHQQRYAGPLPIPLNWAYLQKGEHRFDFCGWSCLIWFVDDIDSNMPDKCGQCRQLEFATQPGVWNCKHPFTLAISREPLSVKLEGEPPESCPLRIMNEMDDEDEPDPMSDSAEDSG